MFQASNQCGKETHKGQIKDQGWALSNGQGKTMLASGWSPANMKHCDRRGVPSNSQEKSRSSSSRPFASVYQLLRRKKKDLNCAFWLFFFSFSLIVNAKIWWMKIKKVLEDHHLQHNLGWGGGGQIFLKMRHTKERPCHLGNWFTFDCNTDRV